MYMYKPLQIKAPHTRNAKKPPLNRPSQYKPSGVALGKAKFCIFLYFPKNLLLRVPNNCPPYISPSESPGTYFWNFMICHLCHSLLVTSRTDSIAEVIQFLVLSGLIEMIAFFTYFLCPEFRLCAQIHQLF